MPRYNTFELPGRTRTFDRIGIADMQGVRFGRAAGGTDRIRDCGAGLDITRCADDMRAMRGEQMGGGLADAARCAADQRDLAGEVEERVGCRHGWAESWSGDESAHAAACYAAETSTAHIWHRWTRIDDAF